ncbi:MAG: flavoprotein [Planctomycetota bacterium]|jgi:phosphopantothenoylcysteine decarboxylase/phosphopantothenate--cysteine ligase
MKVLLGVGGGIAAFKAAALASQLVQEGCSLRVAMTRDAHHFIGATTFAGLTGRQVIESSTQVDADGSAPHIQATQEADCYVIMPATASLIARLAAGVCDDPVTLCAVAFRGRRILCPAMNDAMWEDRSVQRNVEVLRGDGYEILGPVEGHLAEGYAAMGRMIEPEAVLAAVLGKG